jgi:alkanesulfonate monooxygenase SsuD/methylene tetrahydromethanopterin reductase-like flavin-dependent oxidoreductase (luciferase family)
MIFSKFLNATNWHKRPYTEILDEVREITEYLDQNSNFRQVWLSEHHLQTTNNWTMEAIPNPLLMGADLASRTKNIRIGLAAAIITFWNPLRIAEDIAMLDNLSSGRLDVGVGRGVYNKEAIHMNIEGDLKDQPKNFRLFVETLEILKKAWNQEYFSHKGEFYEYPANNFKYTNPLLNETPDVVDPETNILKKISIVPKPYQKDLPLWQVVDSESSIKYAASNGLNCLMWLPPTSSLKSRFEIYANAKSEAENRDVPMGEGITLVRDCFIADTMEEAKELAGEHFLRYLHSVAGGGRGVGIFANPGEELPKTDNPLDILTYDWVHPRNQLVGTAEFVIEKIHELKSELNLQHLAIWSTPPGMPHDASMKSLKYFIERVEPHFSDDKLIKKVS